MKYYKALFFGSIGSIVETSDIQRKSFNQAFKQHGLEWNWTRSEYQSLLSKSGGKDRISRYALKKKNIVNSAYLRNLKTKIFNNYLKKNYLKLRPGVKNLISLCKKKNKNCICFIYIFKQYKCNFIFFKKSVIKEILLYRECKISKKIKTQPRYILIST